MACINNLKQNPSADLECNSTRQMHSFSYLQDRVNYVVLSTGDTIRIARVDAHVARVYFVDVAGNQIPIPLHYVMRDSTGAPVPPLGNNYVVTWTTSYQLFHIGVAPVFSLLQQKQQAVYATGNLKWGIIEPPIAVPVNSTH